MEPAMPIDVLKRIPFALAAFAEVCGTPGSYERERARIFELGIRAEIEWIVANLTAAGEGNRNMGVSRYPAKEDKK